MPIKNNKVLLIYNSYYPHIDTKVNFIKKSPLEQFLAVRIMSLICCSLFKYYITTSNYTEVRLQ